MPVDEPCTKRRVRATSEEEDGPEKVVEEVNNSERGEEVVEEEKKEEKRMRLTRSRSLTYRGSPRWRRRLWRHTQSARARSHGTKETILAANDRGDADYLRVRCRTTKKTVNKLFANTRDSFVTAAKNAQARSAWCLRLCSLAPSIALRPLPPGRPPTHTTRSCKSSPRIVASRCDVGV